MFSVKKYLSCSFFLLCFSLFFSLYLFETEAVAVPVNASADTSADTNESLPVENKNNEQKNRSPAVSFTEKNANTNKNERHYVDNDSAPARALPDLDLKKDINDSVTSNNKTNHLASFNSTKIAGELSEISKEVQVQSELKHGKNIKNILKHKAVQAGAAYGNKQLTSFLNHYGSTDLHVDLQDNLSLDSFTFDYLWPFYVSKQTIGFAQVGYHDWDKRHLLATGLGYRALHDSFMWGINVFLDKDTTLGYRRLSLGFELGKDYFFSYGNYYLPITTWHTINPSAGLLLESAPVDGWDLGIKTVFPFCPALSGSIGYFQWYGHHADLLGGFHEHASAKRYADLEMHNPWGFDLALEYRPVPLVGAEIKEKVGGRSINDFQVSVNLNVNFDQSLSAQLTAGSLSSHMLNSLERVFVRRNNHMVLDYREHSFFQKSITVLLGSVYEVGEQQAMTLSPSVTTAFPVHSYLWEGDGAQFLSQNNIQHPVFTAPFWAGLGVGKNEYGLSLTAVDELGRSYTAHTTVKVKKDTELDPDILFYTDSANTTEVLSYSVGYRELSKAPTIYWHMSSNRGSGATPSFKWEGDVSVLLDSSLEFPVVDVTAAAGHHVLVLVTTSADDGISHISVPVDIYANEGRRLRAGSNVIKEYAPAPGNTFDQPATGIDNSGAITYDSSDQNVATVNGAGTVTILAAGVTTITVTEAPSGNFAGDQDSYQLTVTKARTDLAWGTGGSHTVTNGQVLAKVADLTVNIPAEYTVGGTTITYSLEDDTTGGASISGSTVTINGTGTVRVVATQATDTNANYLETVISYDLVIGKTVPDFTWTTPGVGSIEYGTAPTETVEAESSNSFGAVTYSSSNTKVATIDSVGVITINSVGSTNIIALLAADAGYVGASIEYPLDITKAAAAVNPSFTAATVEHNAGDPNFTIIATPASDSDGAITYASGTTATATVDQATGEVTIVAPGATVITATQAAGTNYPAGGTASYDLTVNAIPSNLAWTAPGAAASGIVTMTMGDAPLTITAEGNSSGGAISYAVDDVAVATFGGTDLTAVAPGSTTVTATQAANGNHAETIVTFTLVVNSRTVHSDLAWDGSGSNPVTNGQVVVELGTDTAFTNVAVSLDNTTGNIVHSIVGDANAADIATIDSASGLVTLGTRAGVVTVVATQAASTDGAYGETIIQYRLQVNLNPAPGFDWDGTPPVATEDAIIGTPHGPFTASSAAGSTGAVTYSSSDTSVVTVGQDGWLLPLTAGTGVTITAHLAEDTEYASADLTYLVDVTPGPYSAPSTLFRWSTGIASGDSVSISYGETPPQITAIAVNPSAVISYTSNSPAVDVSDTGVLSVGSITTTPVTITASVPAFSIYPGMSITYLLTVNAADSNLSWDNVMPFGGTRTLAYGESPAVTASGSDSAGAITYSATGAVSITSDTGVITTESIGAATITATQAAAGNFAETTVTSTVTVVAAPVELLWSEADAISGTVSTSFDAASYQSTVTAGGVPGVTTYSVDPASAQDVVTVDNDSGLVTFNKAGQVGIIATFTPDEQTHAISTTGYNLIIGKGDGLLLFAGNDRKENYAPNGKFTQAAQNVDPGTVITYQSTDDKVATVAEDGEVTIKGVGTARIVVTELPSDKFRREQSSYLLTVVAVNTDLVWNDVSGELKDGQVITEMTAGTVDIPAVTTLGTGAVSYGIEGDSSIAEISSAAASVVTIKAPGIVRVVATQAADDNYLETSISYSLVIGKSLPDFTWTLEPSSIKYSRGGTEKATAVSNESNGNVTYASSNTRVAEINSTTGDITVYGAGTTTIVARVAPSSDGRYLVKRIRYVLTVTQADANDTLSFHGVDAGGSITHKFGGADFVIAAVSTGDSDGVITYESDDPNIAAVNPDTGVISINAAGTVTIRAQQAAGTNYPSGEISFDLIIDPVPATITWDMPVDALNGVVVSTVGDMPFTTTATSNAAGAAVTYTSSNENVATVSGDQVTVKSVGIAMITAHYPEAGNYTATDASYVLVVTATK